MPMFTYKTPEDTLREMEESRKRIESRNAPAPVPEQGLNANSEVFRYGAKPDYFGSDAGTGSARTQAWQEVKRVWSEAREGERQKYRAQLVQAFSGDPLAAIPGDIKNRQEAEYRTALMDDPDTERKKIALAYYFAQDNPENIGFVYENIDQFCERFAGGKTSPGKVYDEIADIVAFNKALPGDYRAYREWRDNHGMWRGLWGMVEMGGLGIYQYMQNTGVAISNLLSYQKLEDGRTVMSHLEEEQRSILQPELHKNTVEWQAERNRTMREHYGLGQADIGLSAGLVPQKPNKLGIFDLPALPDFDTSSFGGAAQAGNEQAAANWMKIIKANPDKYPWAQDCSNPVQVEKAYWNEVAKRHKELSGVDMSAVLERKLYQVDAKYGDKEERLAKGLAVEERALQKVRDANDYVKGLITEAQEKYHPDKHEGETVASMFRDGKYMTGVLESLSIIYDQVTENIVPMALTYATTGGAGSNLIFAASMYGEGFNTAQENNLNVEDSMDYAGFYTAYEVLPEIALGWFPILKHLTPAGRKAVRQGLPNAVKDYAKAFAKGGFSDTAGELITFAFEKAEDAIRGIGLPNDKTNWDDLTEDEKQDFLTSGLVETIIGSFFTAGLGEAMARRGERGDIKQFNLAAERWIQVIESRVAELQEKPALEEAEAAELRELETVLDNGNYSDFLRMVNRETIREMLFEAKKSTQQPRMETPETNEKVGLQDGVQEGAAPQTGVEKGGLQEQSQDVGTDGTQISEAAEEGEAEASARAERELKLRRDLPHNPADSAAEVEKWKKLFPNANIQTTDAWTPEQIRILRRRGVLAPEKAQGMFDIKTNTVILNVSNLRPSEVGFKVLHEVGLHYGIRQAFGDEAANTLFLAVFDAMQDSPFMQRIIDAYKLRTPMLDENGEAIYNPDGTPLLDDMTDAQKAEAAEEFLAFAAETYGVPIDEIYADNRAEIDKWGREHGRDTHDWNEKRRMTREWMAETGFKPERPGWWKQLISQIRVWLAEHGFGHLREADIETIIQDAFRGANRSNRTNRTNGEARYSVDESLKAVFQAEEDADIRQAYPQRSGYNLKQMKKQLLPLFRNKTFVNRDTGIKAQVNSEQRKELISPKAVSRTIANGTVNGVETLFAQDHFDAAANIDALYENAVLLQKRDDLKNEKQDVIIRLFAAPFVIRGEVYDAIMTQKESTDKKNSARVYFLELDEIAKREPGGGARPDLPSPSEIPRLTRENSLSDGWNKLQQKREKVKRFLEKNQKKSDGARFSVSPVWTGSAADYEQPSLNYVGTGEGQQVYGWGLYGSSARDVAEWYANNDAYDKIRKNLVTYFINEKEIKNSAQFYSDNLKGKVGFLDYHFVEAMSIALDAAYMGMNVGNKLKRGIERATREYGVNGGFTQALRYLLDLYEKGEFRVQKNSTDPTGKRNLYKQTFWPDKEENLLDWDEKIPEEQARQIFDALAEMHGDKAIVSFINREREDWQTDENREVEDEPTEYPDDVAREYLEQFLDFYEASGEWVYKQLSDLLGSPKAASEFLYRAGIDGITYIGESSDVRDYVAFSDQDIRVDEHIRYSLTDIDGNEAARSYIDIIKPYVPFDVHDKDGAYYAQILKEKAGVDLEPEDAMQIAQEAWHERRKASVKKSWDQAYAYYAQSNPLFDFLLGFAGSDFKIRPAHRFEGEKFTGSFIVPEFVKYSEKREQGERETNWSYNRYKEKRERALKSAKGMHSDEAAMAYVRQFGGDELEVEQQIIDLLRDLKRTDIRSSYAQFKRENFARDRMEQAEYEAMMEDIFQRELDDKVVSILSAGVPVVTPDWVAENRDVYKELYKRLLSKDGKEAPYTPSQKDIEAMNSALIQEGADAATYAKAYKEARAASAREWMEKVSELRQKVIEGKENAMKLQREAAALLKRAGLEGDRSFSARIINLMGFQTEARRQQAFDQLMSDILAAGTAAKQMKVYDRLLERLQQLGRRADVGRKAIGVRDEATQIQIDKIRDIAAMSTYEIAARQGELQDAINAAQEHGESSVEFEEEMALLSKYGDLANKTAAELTLALADLNELAVTGKRKIRERLMERQGQDRMRIQESVDLINGGNFATMGDLDELENRRNQEAGTLKATAAFDLFSGFNLWGKLTALNLAGNKNIRDTVFYRMMEQTHECARNQDTMNEKHQQDTLAAIDRIFGTKGAFERAAKLQELRKVQDKTGVMRRYIDREKKIEYRKMGLDEARELLKDYDNKTAAGERPALKDYEAEAIRHQLLVYDRKLDKKATEYLDSVTEKLIQMAEEEKERGEKTVVIPVPKYTAESELKLSQMQALYQYLMWQQKNTRYKMVFNGWTEDSIKQLEGFLTPETKAFGGWMTEQLEADRADIDPVYERLYMTAFPHVESYFPAVYHHRGQNTRLGNAQGVDLGAAGAGGQPMAFSPGALRQRVFHMSELRNVDALNVFQNHRMIMTHFVTHGEAARELRAVFANKDVKQAIIEQLGSKQYSSLTEDIADFINGGHVQIDKAAALRGLYSAAVRSKMMINITSGIKQTLGGLTYLQDIPLKDFVAGVNYAVAHPKEVWQTLGKTEYFQNRWRSGSNRDLRMLLDRAGKNGQMDVLMEKADTLSSIPLRLGDAGAVLFGGYAVYRYTYQQGIKRGLSEAEAKRRALLEWEMSTERTQQSSQVHMLNKMQKGSTLDRIFTTYLSNQILMWNHYAPRFFKGDILGGARGMAAAAITSVAMTTMNQLFRKGIWVDDWEFWDYFWDYLSDVLNGSGATGVILGRAIEGANAYGRGANVLQSDEMRAAHAARNLYGDVSDEEYKKALKDAIDILTVAGYFYPPITPALSAVREGRKTKNFWQRLFSRDDNEKKTRKNLRK